MSYDVYFKLFSSYIIKFMIYLNRLSEVRGINMKKNKKKLNIKKIIKLIVSIVMLILSLILFKNIYNLNILPTKYLILVLGIILFLNILGTLFLFIKGIITKILSGLLYVILGIITIIGIKYTNNTLEYLNKGFNNNNIEYIVYNIIVSNDSNSQSIKDLNNTDMGYLFIDIDDDRYLDLIKDKVNIVYSISLLKPLFKYSSVLLAYLIPMMDMNANNRYNIPLNILVIIPFININIVDIIFNIKITPKNKNKYLLGRISKSHTYLKHTNDSINIIIDIINFIIFFLFNFLFFFFVILDYLSILYKYITKIIIYKRKNICIILQFSFFVV